MTEETFAHIAFISLLIYGVGLGVTILCFPKIDRWLEKRKKKRAAAA